MRDQDKYGRMVGFAQALPRIRARCDEDLGRPGLSRAKVLATIVRLLEGTLVRVGNEEYARDNKSFGLTTMRNRHVDVTGSTVTFQFRGKSGKGALGRHDRPPGRAGGPSLRRAPRLRVVPVPRRGGERHSIDSQDVNEYLEEALAGADFTAGTSGTWAGTVLAAQALQEMEALAARRRPRATSSRRSSASRSGSGTRKRSAASAMSTPTSSTPTSTGRCCAR